MRDGTLLAQPFDADKRQLTGEPFRVADQVGAHAYGIGLFSVSENGVLVYASVGSSSGGQLGWFDRAGKRLGLIGSAGDNSYVRFSPDEKQVAVSRFDLQTRHFNTWLLNLSRGADSRLSFTPGGSIVPIWSPDGSRIIPWSGDRNLYQKASSGVGQEEILLKSDRRADACDWSGDGRFIAYETYDPQGRLDLWLLPLEGDRRPKPWLETPFNETNARFSPDSRWLAYISDESGGNEGLRPGFFRLPVVNGKVFNREAPTSTRFRARWERTVLRCRRPQADGSRREEWCKF